MTALVLDGDHRGALSIVRSLGARGIPVTVAWHEPVSLAGLSRYCSESIICPSPHSSQLFLEWLCKTVSNMPSTVIYTGSDLTTSIVCKYRLCLPETVRLALPPQESVEVALSKAATLDLARSLSVPIPKSVRFDRLDSVDPAVIDFDYPVVIKAAQSDLCGRAPTAYAHDAMELRDVLRRTMRGSEPVLVQELITGEGTGIFALFDHGQPIVTFAHRRCCEHPPWGGVSAISESIPEPDDTLEYALWILRELNWHGIAMVEFKRRADGNPCLMEINPRFWGSLELAIKSGIDFPHLYYQLVTGEQIEPLRSSHSAVNRWFLGEMDSLITGLRYRGRPDGLPHSRLRLALSHIASLRHGLCLEVERLGDPKPAIYEHVKWLRSSVHAAFGRKGGARR